MADAPKASNSAILENAAEFGEALRDVGAMDDETAVLLRTEANRARLEASIANLSAHQRLAWMAAAQAACDKASEVSAKDPTEHHSGVAP